MSTSSPEEKQDIDPSQDHNHKPSQRGKQTPKRPPVQRILITGVDELSTSVIGSKLTRICPTLRSTRPTFSKTPSGSGIILSHPSAYSIIDLNLDDKLFGEGYRFKLSRMSNTPPTLFVRGIPKHLTNDDILDAIIGAYKVTRLRTIQSRAYIKFTNEETRALALRDGVTIRNSTLLFEIPLPQSCRRCFSQDHQYCQEPPRCFRCVEDSHTIKDCENEMFCMLCSKTDHVTRACPKYRRWQT